MSFGQLNLENFIANHHKDGELFLLVDGAQIDHKEISNIESTYGECIYLFKGTFEEEAYQYGPILFELKHLNQEHIENHIRLMKSKDSMILIKSQLDTKQLKNKLLEKLYIELEDGGIGILRYYDPRVLNRLMHIFTSSQKKALLDGFESISFMLNELSYELKYND
ncbi:DUF4123 domain-containing protein [Acinetobacter baumannii]|uniref:DUF4123 domain-containing protein n=1 Tax=Acinetobacter baumannii TaxID=470 RepID=UPI0021525C12|nr:DUF4123 domain-containing protein [Acinetobacter baumannii]MCR6569680.1 DUF4123 domain-containing protein [Acinetobacter baumannii]MDV4323692.1 DUF4123 domain-containing protein [Acinetobacter baumannii]MDV4338224.1 DUF4123 domain-containing protein [Acinetobacter baumannii]